MRLLDCDTLQFKTFNEKDLPGYAILSHTWGKEEVNYQEMRWLQKLKTIPAELRSSPLCQLLLDSEIQFPSAEAGITVRAGYDKIRMTAKLAKERGYQYFWIDTCCIDKSNSAELQEVINSMYRLYQKSSVCMVYLEDAAAVPENERTDDYIENEIKGSRWVTRGWTLQELIAPACVVFYDKIWNFMCDKRQSLVPLRRATGINEKVLASGDVSQYCVAERMSWAARRSTTRVEDIAYCLMGLFDINMPMLYGEGDKAFIRLQEHIMARYADDSLLAWEALSGDISTYRGLLARSPVEFMNGGNFRRGNASVMSSTSLGVYVSVNMVPLKSNDANHYVASLRANHNNKKSIGIILRKLQPNEEQYARVDPHLLVATHHRKIGKKRSIYVRQTISVPPGYIVREMHCFHLNFQQSTLRNHHIRVDAFWPSKYWNSETWEVLIPNGYLWFQCGLLLRPFLSSEQLHCHCPSFLVFLAFNRNNPCAKCKLGDFPYKVAPISSGDWRRHLRKFGSIDGWGEQGSISFEQCFRHNVNRWWVEIEPTIRNDRISFAVHIGLENLS